MSINPISSGSTPQIITAPTQTESGKGFGDALLDATKQTAHLENQANEMAQKIAGGDVGELHNAMIAMQKASMALELTVQVRNKVLEAYQEIMRMQI